MDPLTNLGRWIVYTGLLLVAVGGMIWLIGKIPGLDRLPGTWVWKGEHWTFVAPIGAMILISLILTLLLNVVARLFR